MVMDERGTRHKKRSEPRSQESVSQVLAATGFMLAEFGKKNSGMDDFVTRYKGVL